MAITAAAVKELREITGAGMMDCKKALTETNGDMQAAQDWLREKGIAKAAKKGDRIAAEGLTAVKEAGNDVVILEVNSETDFVAKNEQFLSLLDQIGTILLENKPADVEAALAVDVNGKTLDEVMTEAIATIGEKLTIRRFEIITKAEGQEVGVYSHAGGKISVVTLIEGGSSEVAKDVSMHTAAINPRFKTQDEVPADEVEKERKILTEEAMAEGKPAEIAAKMVEGRLRKYFAEIVLLDQSFVKDGDVTVGKYLDNNSAKLVNVVRYEVGEGIEKEEVDFAAEVAAQANL